MRKTFDQYTPEERREIAARGGRGGLLSEVRRIARETLLYEDEETGKTRLQAIAETMADKGAKGDVQAAQFALRMAAVNIDAPTQEESVAEIAQKTLERIHAFLEWQRLSGSNMAFVYGTTRSGKTYAILQWLVEMLRSGRRKGRILVGGQTMPFLRNGSIAYLQQICSGMQDIEVVDHGRIIRHANGEIVCQSFDDPSKALSAQWSDVFLNEGNYITQEVTDQLRVRTAGMIICDYNPSVAQWWGSRLQTPTNELFCKFSDNPFLSANQLAAIEDIRTRGESAPAGSYENWFYNVYYLGKYSEMGGGVFRSVYRCTEEEYKDAELVEVWGIDFGDVTDPNALVSVKVNVAERVMWVWCRLYETAVDDPTMVARLNALNIPRLVCETATGGNTRMANFKTLGFKGRVVPCEKEQVAQGVFNICGYRINCVDDITYDEFRGYKIDEGKFSGADHCIDAVRYVAHLILTNKIR